MGEGGGADHELQDYITVSLVSVYLATGSPKAVCMSVLAPTSHMIAELWEQPVSLGCLVTAEVEWGTLYSEVLSGLIEEGDPVTQYKRNLGDNMLSESSRSHMMRTTGSQGRK